MGGGRWVKVSNEAGDALLAVVAVFVVVVVEVVCCWKVDVAVCVRQEVVEVSKFVW